MPKSRAFLYAADPVATSWVARPMESKMGTSSGLVLPGTFPVTRSPYWAYTSPGGKLPSEMGT